MHITMTAPTKTAVTATLDPFVSKQWEDPIHLTNYYKTEACKKFASRTTCDYTHCPFYHGKKERRRSFETYSYTSQACEHVKVGEEWKDSASCPNKDECPKCHTRMEQQFHPEVYKKMQCKDLQTGGDCPRKMFCAFAHYDGEIQGKRCPEWKFDWGKILPPGLQAQYNYTRRGNGKKSIGNESEVVNTCTISKSIVCSKNSTVPKLTSGSNSISPSLDNPEFEVIFIDSPKIIEPLPYTFAAILAGNKDVSSGNENISPCNLELPTDENKEAELLKDELTSEEISLPTNTSSFGATFADILSGAKSRSEALPNRLISLHPLNKKQSNERPVTFTPLPLRDNTNNEDVATKSRFSSPEHHTIQIPITSDDLCDAQRFDVDVFNKDSSEVASNICKQNSEDVERSNNMETVKEAADRRERTLTEEYEDISDLEIDTLTLYDSRDFRKILKRKESVNETDLPSSRSSISFDISSEQDGLSTSEVNCEFTDDNTDHDNSDLKLGSASSSQSTRSRSPDQECYPIGNRIEAPMWRPDALSDVVRPPPGLEREFRNPLPNLSENVFDELGLNFWVQNPKDYESRTKVTSKELASIVRNVLHVNVLKGKEYPLQQKQSSEQVLGSGDRYQSSSFEWDNGLGQTRIFQSRLSHKQVVYTDEEPCLLDVPAREHEPARTRFNLMKTITPSIVQGFNPASFATRQTQVVQSQEFQNHSHVEALKRSQISQRQLGQTHQIIQNPRSQRCNNSPNHSGVNSQVNNGKRTTRSHELNCRTSGQRLKNNYPLDTRCPNRDTSEIFFGPEQFYTYGVNCCSDPSHTNPWLEDLAQSTPANYTAWSNEDNDSQCEGTREKHHLDLWTPYYTYQQ